MQSELSNKGNNVGCDEVRSWLGAYSDGELDPERARLVRQHLRACSNCREELARLETIAAAVKQLPTPAPSPDFFAELRRTVRREVARRAATGWLGDRGASARASWRPRVATALVATVLVGVVILSVEIWRSGSAQRKLVEKSAPPQPVLQQKPGEANETAGRRPVAFSKMPESGVTGRTTKSRDEKAFVSADEEANSFVFSGEAEPKKIPRLTAKAARDKHRGETLSSLRALVAERAEVGGAAGFGGEEVAPRARQTPAREPQRAIVPALVGPPARAPMRKTALDSLRQISADARTASSAIELVASGLASADTLRQRLGSRGLAELVYGLKGRELQLAEQLQEVLTKYRDKLAFYLGEARVDSLQDRLAALRKAAAERP